MKRKEVPSILLNDVKRARLKRLCNYFKAKPELLKYPGIMGHVNLMDEIKLLSSGKSLTYISAVIDEFESKPKVKK